VTTLARVDGVPVQLELIRKREAAYFLPVVKRLPVAVASGRGSRVVDVTGREYVDLTAGWGVTAIGHCHPALVEAIRTQAGRLMQTTNIVYTLPQLDLAERLARLTRRALPRAFFVSSGAEAMDGALKLAHRATGRTRFLATRQSFHGRTLFALGVTGQAKHQDPYRALLSQTSLVLYDDLDAARAAIDEQTAAFVVEPVQGEGGVNVPRPGYLAGLRRLCDAAGALLILDEIQTGIGRTGRMFGYEHDGVAPDVMTLGKGLGGGFPIAAFLCSEALARTVSLGDHGGTYAGNPLACATAETVLEVIEEEKLVERAAELGARVETRLRAFAAERPDRVADVRGKGLLLGIELRDADRAATLALRALERGVLINVTAGTVFRLFPALNIPEDDLFTALGTVLALIAD
jgi:acetylornithine/N-succinyldiaminopimelate aminotransferase